MSGNDIFVSTYDGGLYDGGVFRSTNNGASWTQVNSNLNPRLEVISIVVSGSNIFAGTVGSCLFLSTNNGTTWTAVNTGFGFQDGQIYCLAVSGSNIFAGTQNSGVYLSTNNGLSWTTINDGLTNKNVQCLAFSSTHIFAGTYGGGVFSMPLSAISKVDENSTPSPSAFISPQPVRDEAEITFDTKTANVGFESGISIELYDIKGTLVATYNFTSLSEGSNKLRFDVRNLVSGMYNVIIKSGTEVHQAKMIKVD